MTKLLNILDQIDSGTVLLPEFQRGYVWNRDQVRGLMRSLYRGYPVGSLLVWETEADGAAVRGAARQITGPKLLLLDGQQRITSLYGVARGRPPAFFDGNAAAFTGLRFNVSDETFEFYAPAKMKDDPRWIDVTRLFRDGLEPMIGQLHEHPDTRAEFASYVVRLTRLRELLERDFHEEKITGSDKSIDDVVDIFNRVNSGGTKLSKGDLALANICAAWPEARGTMRAHLDRWKQAGYERFTLDWLLRSVNAVATGRAPFAALESVDAGTFERALGDAANHIGKFLDLTAGRLGLDHGRVLMGHYAFPVVSRLLHRNGGSFANAAESDRVLYWYVQAALWGRFAGSTETVLARDYATAEQSGIDGLISTLERWRGGNLRIDPDDFHGFTRGARFYPLLYLLTRVRGARDFGSGLELHSHLLGKLTGLQIHHIFPKALLQGKQPQGLVNAVANFCFLTQETNLKIGKRPPADYLAEAEAAHPGVLASQWIPQDRTLWEVDRYPDFLAERRRLLADAANAFLAELRDGSASSTAPKLERIVVQPEEDADDVRVAQVKALVSELTSLGCTEAALDTEIADPDTGTVLAVAEAFWPDGLQTGQGAPVVLELDPEDSDIVRMRELGYEVFTSADALRGFVLRRNEVAAGQRTEMDESAGPVDDESLNAGALESDFHSAMITLYGRAKTEAGYHAPYLLRMVSDRGGPDTARHLLATPHISDGFRTLWERGRLDLSVEALVCEPRFAPLFTSAELEIAHQRLEQFKNRS